MVLKNQSERIDFFVHYCKDMNKESKKYPENKNLKNVDEFKSPNLTFNEKREYTELQDKELKTAEPKYFYVDDIFTIFLREK